MRHQDVGRRHRPDAPDVARLHATVAYTRLSPHLHSGAESYSGVSRLHAERYPASCITSSSGRVFGATSSLGAWCTLLRYRQNGAAMDYLRRIAPGRTVAGASEHKFTLPASHAESHACRGMSMHMQSHRVTRSAVESNHGRPIICPVAAVYMPCPCQSVMHACHKLRHHSYPTVNPYSLPCVPSAVCIHACSAASHPACSRARPHSNSHVSAAR